MIFIGLRENLSVRFSLFFSLIMGENMLINEGFLLTIIEKCVMLSKKGNNETL